MRFDKATLLFLLAALALYYFHFFLTPWDQFTLDPSAHAGYITYIVTHHALPPITENPAARHPPTYYLLAAGLYELGLHEGDAQPLLVARHLSMALFIVFTLFSVHWLRVFLPPPQKAYYCALALLLFWPLGVTMGARLTCDLLLYAGQAAVLYMLVRFLETRSPAWLRNAFIATGICLLAKNTGIVMLMITAGVCACELFQRRREWRLFVRKDLMLSILFTVGCYWVTSLRGWVMDAQKIAGVDYDLYYWLRSFMSFNPVMFVTDAGTSDSRGMFWNMLLHSLLSGDILPWKTTFILMAGNACWLAIMIYMLEAMLRRSRDFKNASPRPRAGDEAATQLMIAYIVLTLAAMMFMSVKTDNLLYADGRYLYPAVPILAIGYGKAVEGNRAACRMTAYRMGLLLAALFVASTLLLFASQQWE